jgi:hypothetical protein
MLILESLRILCLPSNHKVAKHLTNDHPITGGGTFDHPITTGYTTKTDILLFPLSSGKTRTHRFKITDKGSVENFPFNESGRKNRAAHTVTLQLVRVRATTTTRGAYNARPDEFFFKRGLPLARILNQQSIREPVTPAEESDAPHSACPSLPEF